MRLFLWLLPAVMAVSSPVPANALCRPDSFDGTAVVAGIHDGDTLRLADGRKVRLIGLNAPELARDDQAQQPFATEARTALGAILKPGTEVKLLLGRERQDRYGRTLAHVFLANGTNVQARLIEQGLATAWVVPPNERLSACYQQAEHAARCQSRGLWTQPDYAVHMVSSLNRHDTGFRRVRGRVTRIHRSEKGDLWLTLERTVQVHIRRHDVDRFERQALTRLKGAHITVRGWLHPRGKGRQGFYLALRHPSALNSAAADSCL